MAQPYQLAHGPRRRGLDRFLLDGERIVVKGHHHWAKIALPVLYLLGASILVLVLDSTVPASLAPLVNPLWLAWIALVGWVGWQLARWRHDWFVATDKRLILTSGLISQKVGMMPLPKVTDMSYNRSALGRLLGYGTFVMESAGQEQALHTVRWVAKPDHTYRVICTEIFEVAAQAQVPEEDEARHHFGWGPRLRTAGPYTDFARAPNQPGSTDPSTGIRPRPAEAAQREAAQREAEQREAQHPEPDHPGLDGRDADTGPIPYGD